MFTAMLSSSQRSAAGLGSAWKKHSFPYCCVIACVQICGSTIAAWGKYATIITTGSFMK
jgi:hypothetical protein